MKVLRDAISSRGYAASNIFNMDETALFYKTTPNKTYLVPEGDKRQIGKGTKQMKAKDRLTTILCVNATGTCKITPVIIGSAKNPRCFSRYPPVHALPYFQQKSAWSDSVLHKRWWNEVFLPGIREWTKQPVALLLDGFSSHVDDCVDPLGQVTVFKFPPNITSIYQPLDQGMDHRSFQVLLQEKAARNSGNNSTKLFTTASPSFTTACWMCWACIWKSFTHK